MKRHPAVLQLGPLAVNSGLAGIVALALAAAWYAVQQLQGGATRFLAQ